METTTQQQEEGELGLTTQLFPNKYKHPEFAGHTGEHLLNRVLKSILSLSLYRTWESMVKLQAPGNDCWASTEYLSSLNSRSERTIRLNIHDLEQQGLVEQRCEWKTFTHEDGSQYSRMITIKDFSGLYDLALEYLEWTKSPFYIEAKRDFAEYMKKNEQLKRKLVRFDNYRKIIDNKIPGPPPTEKKSYARYREYDLLQDDQYLYITPPIKIEQAERNKLLHKSLHINSSNEEERKTSNNNLDEYDSNSGSTSFSSLEGDVVSNHTKPLVEEESIEQTSLPPQHKGNSREASSQFNNDNKASGVKRSEPAANSLVSDFVREISPLFNDHNPKSSHTRVLRIAEDAQLCELDLLACLVHAYCIARDTSEVKEQHRHPDGDNKMPLFCYLFTQFTHICAQGKLKYPDNQLADDIAGDDRLVLFVTEHGSISQEEAQYPQDDAHYSQEESQPPQDDSQEVTEWQYYDVSAIGTQSPAQDTYDVSVEEVEEVAQYIVQKKMQVCINAESEEQGWSDELNAKYWAEQILNKYPGYYKRKVYPTQYGRYGFMLYMRDDKDNCMVFLTNAEVREYLASDGSMLC